MKKTSKKTLKRADGKSVSYRLTGVQLVKAKEDLEHENETRGAFPVSLTAYAKHALLEHQELVIENQRLLGIENRLRALKEKVGDGAGVNADWIAEQFAQLIDGASL